MTGDGLSQRALHLYHAAVFPGDARELEEAAFIDGAGLLRTFFRVMLPEASPG